MAALIRVVLVVMERSRWTYTYLLDKIDVWLVLGAERKELKISPRFCLFVCFQLSGC